MIYCMFAFWLLAIVFAARGMLKLWGQMVKPKVVAWAVLPGTLVSEVLHMVACLLTGAEFRPRKLLESEDDPRPVSAEKGGMKYLTPLLTAMLPLIGCMALIVLAGAQLGGDVFEGADFEDVSVTSSIPYLSEGTIWTILENQVHVLDAQFSNLGNALWSWPWMNWRSWLFVYLMICLIARMAPNGRPLRPVLAGTVVIAAVTAAVVAVLSTDEGWLHSLWPILSFTWATAATLLALTLCIRGAIGLANVLRGRE